MRQYKEKKLEKVKPSKVIIFLYQEHVKDFQCHVKEMMENGYDGSVTSIFGAEDVSDQVFR